MLRRLYKLALGLIITLVLGLAITPEHVSAAWPPFDFTLSPSYDNGKVTYNINFLLDTKDFDGVMTNVTFKIPLPQGTQFISAQAQPSTQASFNGTEIVFFTASLANLKTSQYSSKVQINVASFVVELIDPAQQVVTTQPLISWEGDHPGFYLAEEVSFDITRPALNWTMPAQSRLELKITATATEGIITFEVYPTNVGELRMWDLTINLPIPSGTVFAAAEAHPSFTPTYNGQEVSFFAVELARRADIPPLRVKVSVGEDALSSPVVTHAWATWKNVGRQVGQSAEAREETRSGTIAVVPGFSQVVSADVIGDVPFSNYDLTSVSFRQEGDYLRVDFYPAGNVGPTDASIEFIVYIDQDCQRSTGQQRGSQGVESRVRYRLQPNSKDLADFRIWDQQEKTWTGRERLNGQATGEAYTLWLPRNLLENGDEFCWHGRARNASGVFNDSLPDDYLMDASLTHYRAVGTNPGPVFLEQFDEAAEPSDGAFIISGDTWQFLPGWTEPPPNWGKSDFDYSGWFSGPARIGYGPGEYATDISTIVPKAYSNSDMSMLVQRTITETGVILAILPSGETDNLYLRRVFQVDDPSALTGLQLEVSYEGGFVAYLNGVEVARRGVEQTQGAGTNDSELSYSSAVVDLSNFIPVLTTGPNVLALQVFRLIDEMGLSADAEFTWTTEEPVPVTSSSEAEVAGPTAPVPAPSPAEMPPGEINGKLAIPLDNGQGFYDVYVFSLPAGNEVARISYARQPDFHPDGQHLLINREGGGIEDVYEYNLLDHSERQVSGASQDSHPVYDLGGYRVAYSNPELTVGTGVPARDEEGDIQRNEKGEILYADSRKPFIFVQCGLLPPHQETEPRCRDIPGLGVLVPAGHMGEIQGTHPVWTSNDMIAYKGCNTWAGSRLCGIYIVPSASTKGLSDGFIPRQIATDTSDTPSDTEGDLIAFTSRRDGNWEAYLMDLDGAEVRNLSNGPTSNDGLPAISPDGNWIAFVSDRDGRWAVWAVPRAGGPAEKLFDLPASTPWGDGDRTWLNERISWGP